MLTVRPFAAPELGNTSFLFSDPDAGVAGVVDPFRDVDGYLSYAADNGLRVVRLTPTSSTISFQVPANSPLSLAPR